MNDHLDAKQSLARTAEVRRSRIEEDIKKVKEHPDYPKLPLMLAAYVDCLILDIELLFKIEEHAQQHIDSLDDMIDRLLALQQQ